MDQFSLPVVWNRPECDSIQPYVEIQYRVSYSAESIGAAVGIRTHKILDEVIPKNYDIATHCSIEKDVQRSTKLNPMDNGSFWAGNRQSGHFKFPQFQLIRRTSSLTGKSVQRVQPDHRHNVDVKKYCCCRSLQMVYGILTFSCSKSAISRPR